MNTKKEAISEILKAIESVHIKEIHENSNDILEYLQLFISYSIEIQLAIIVKYGFSQDNSGDFNYDIKVYIKTEFNLLCYSSLLRFNKICK